MKTAKNLLFFNLARILDKYKITYGQLAEMLQMSPATLSQKMGGKADWKLTEMLKIQSHLYTTTREIYNLDFLFERERE